MNQPVVGQFLQLRQPLELGFLGHQPVTQELLDNLAIGALLGAAPDGFHHAAGHWVFGRQVAD